MKRFTAVKKQRAAVLVVALIMLLALTLLAVSNLRGVTLELRMTANRAATERLYNLADAALREGELRLYQSTDVQGALEADKASCTKNNTLSAAANKPCLLEPMTNNQLQQFFKQPLSFLKSNYAGYDAITGEQVNTASSNATLAWMPYRGLDSNQSHYFQPSQEQRAFWNTYLLLMGAQDNAAANPEYGAALEGRGTFYFLVTAQANDQVAVQSTMAVSYLGLNN